MPCLGFLSPWPFDRRSLFLLWDSALSESLIRLEEIHGQHYLQRLIRRLPLLLLLVRLIVGELDTVRDYRVDQKVVQFAYMP